MREYNYLMDYHVNRTINRNKLDVDGIYDEIKFDNIIFESSFSIPRLRKCFSITIQDCQNVSLNIFKNITSLSQLKIRNCKLDFSIDRLSYIGGLWRIEITECNLTSFKGFEKLKSLISLDLSFNKIESIDDFPFYDLPKLLTLYINHNPLKCVHFTNGSDTLSRLSMESCEIDNISNLYKFNRLEELYVQDNKLTSMMFMNDNPNLKYIDISDNHCAQLPILSSCEKICLIRINNNPIETIKNISHYSSLKKLEIKNTEIESCLGLNNKSLNNLAISSKKLDNFISLQDLPSLEFLDLSNSNLSSIILPSLPLLKELNLSYNNIEEITYFPDFPSLRILYLNNNKIKSLVGINLKHAVPYINLRNNNIESFDDVATLANSNDVDIKLDKNNLKELSGINTIGLLIFFLKDIYLNLSDLRCTEIANSIKDFVEENNIKDIVKYSSPSNIRNLNCINEKREDLLKIVKKINERYSNNFVKKISNFFET